MRIDLICCFENVLNCLFLRQKEIDFLLLSELARKILILSLKMTIGFNATVQLRVVLATGS